MNVLIYHTLEDTLGGAELVLIHTMNYFLQKPGTTVTVLGFHAPNLQQMKEFSGIDLPADRVFSVQVTMPKMMKHVRQGLFLIKAAFLQRKAKEISGSYDLCISTCNEVDFGKRGLQYMHHPQLVPHKLLQKYKIIHEKSLLNRYPYISMPYLALVTLLAGNRKSRIEKNISFTNSFFMREVIKEAYNINAEVIYPSLINLDHLKPTSVQPRALRMISIGRIHSDKGTLELVDLFAAIYRRIPSLELMIAGQVTDFDYYNEVRARAEKLGVPIKFKEDLTRNELQNLLKTSLIFINPKHYEHFGIATLEALAAGCLPFIHRSGGSVEIIPTPQLQYQNEADLVSKVERIVKDESLRADLLKTLDRHLEVFSAENFYKQMDRVVLEFLKPQNASYAAVEDHTSQPVTA